MSNQLLKSFLKLGPSSLSLRRTLQINNKTMIPQTQPCVFISTSKKDRDTATVTPDSPKTIKKDEEPSNVSGKKVYWHSLGFSLNNPDEDQNSANLVMFSTVTLILCGTAFLFTYWPDPKFRDWTQREAFLEIQRREALGLPYIDKDLVPASKFNLPSEEELGDFEIIV